MTHSEAAWGHLAAQIRGRVSTAMADRLACSADLWPLHLIRMAAGRTPEVPDAVVWPADLDDVRRTVLLAQDYQWGLVPYGAGSSVVGGATAGRGRVVLDLKRLDRVLTIDGAARFAHVEAGIVGERLERQLNRAGFTQGHFPSSIYCSSLGGWIAARGAGQMSSRYGKIEDQILGGTVVLGDGTVVRQPLTPGRSALFETLIGAEGTTGIWVDALVRIHPQPRERRFRAFDFPDLPSALEAARAWLFAGVVPSVVRIYDPLDSYLHRGTHGSQPPRDRGPNFLAWVGATFPRLTSAVGDRLAGDCRCVVGFEGDPRVVELEAKTVLHLARAHGGRDLGAEPGEQWYARRYALSYRQSNAFRAGVAVDTMEVACPWERLVPAYQAVRAAALAEGAQVIAHFSHVYLEGASIYFTFAFPAKAGEAGYRRLWQASLQAALGSGANVSHHHGVGKLKSAAALDALGGAQEVLRQTRAEADPGGVLNPDVLGHDRPGAVQFFVPTPKPPSVDALMCLARAEETVGAVEARLRRDMHTLGAVATLFPGTSVVEAARRGHLWRTNPQLQVIEPLVLGADGRASMPYSWLPAPRAAMGPDLWPKLLDTEVTRLWLRVTPMRERRVRLTGPNAPDAAEAIRKSAACRDVLLSLRHDSDGWAAEIALSADERGDVQKGEIRRRADSVCDLHIAPEEAFMSPLSGVLTRVVLPWDKLAETADAVAAVGAWALWPWTDPVGLCGFVVGPADEKKRQDMRAGLYALGVLGLADRVAPPPQEDDRVAREGDVFRGYEEAPAPPRLRLAEHGAALDNCTYCPKMCRFSCDMAVAGANETLIPRQLMLTAALSRNDVLPLHQDSADRLWACVDCGGCRSFCDHDNNVAEVLQEARTELFAKGAAPTRVFEYLRTLRRTGRPPDASAQDAVTEVVHGDSEAPTALFFGCQNTRVDAGPATALVQWMQQHHGAAAVVGTAVGCCGHPLWRWGDREGFRQRARTVAGALQGWREVVVDDPGCAYALQTLYPRVGVKLPPVRTTVSMLEKDAVMGRPLRDHVLHDCCFSIRHLGEPPLRHLWDDAKLPAGSILEGQAGCCGGMLLPVYDATLAQRTAEQRVRDLQGGGAGRIVTAAPTCRRRLRSVGAAVDDLFTVLNRP